MAALFFKTKKTGFIFPVDEGSFLHKRILSELEGYELAADPGKGLDAIKGKSKE